MKRYESEKEAAGNSTCPFPTISLSDSPHLKSAREQKKYYMHMSANVYLISVSRSSQESPSSAPACVPDFKNFCVRIDLKPVAESEEILRKMKNAVLKGDSMSALCDITKDKVDADSQDSCGIKLLGHVVYGNRQSGKRQNPFVRRQKEKKVLLVAETKKDRDKWLLFLQLRLAPREIVLNTLREAFSTKDRLQLDCGFNPSYLLQRSPHHFWGEAASSTGLKSSRLAKARRGSAPFVDAAKAASTILGGMVMVSVQAACSARCLIDIVTDKGAEMKIRAAQIAAKMQNYGDSVFDNILVMCGGDIENPAVMNDYLEKFMISWTALLNAESMLLGSNAALSVSSHQLERLEQTAEKLEECSVSARTVKQGHLRQQECWTLCVLARKSHVMEIGDSNDKCGTRLEAQERYVEEIF